MLNAIISIIASRLMWSFIGIAAISSIIWFIGPITSIGNTIPFESTTVRIIIIISLFFIWVLIQLIPRLYQAWLNKKLSDKLGKNNDEQKHPDSKQTPNEQYATLSERFSDAARLLKNAYFYSLNIKYKLSWRCFLNRQYLYQLPWYVVIGAPQSGKTTILENSDLHFPLSDHFEKSARYNMRGESNSCNWWFTNEAVILDTHGRYTIQHEQDASEWKCFINLLKKYRTRQPLNGVIITISVADLLNSSKEERDKQAYTLRRRLSELHKRLKIQFPIYVIITKTDLLKGFSAYFSHLNKAQHEQIWGFNFPWNKIDWSLNEYFEQQYDLLQNRLNAELPNILLHQNAPRHCAESYLFPQEFVVLRPLIAQYLEITFAKSGFEIPYFPRGLYFSSGTQKGVPFDCVMEKFNRSFQLPTDNDSDSLSWKNKNNENFPAQPPLYQVYFLKNLLVSIFKEAGLASYNRWWIYRNRLLSGLSYIVLAAILGFIITLFLASYSNNKHYLMEIQAKIPSIMNQSAKLIKSAKLTKSSSDIDIYALLPILNNLENFGTSKHFSLDDPPLSYRMGLYCGEQVNNASWSLYKKSLQILLLPKIAKLITLQLNQGNDNNTDNTYILDNYNTLKAYQMLYQPKHYDGKFLHNWVMKYLHTHLPSGISQEQLREINEHLKYLLDNQVVTSPFVRDEQLVVKKQAQFNNIPPAQFIYTHLKNNLLNNRNFPSVNLVTLAGSEAELAFSRISGVSITHGIPGVFTPAGYQAGVGKELNTLIDTFYDQDNWVLDIYERKQSAKDISLLVRLLYIRDYIYQWDTFLSDIQLNDIDSLEQRANMAHLLSSNRSPMRNLLINISKNVTLDEGIISNKTKQISGSILSSKPGLLAKNGSLTKLAPKELLPDKERLPDNNQPTPEQTLKEHFAPIIDLAKSPDGKNKQIPFDEVLTKIDELNKYLNSVQDAVNMGMPIPPDKIITLLQKSAESLPVPFKNMIHALAMGASKDTQVSDIKQLSRHLAAEVSSFCHQAIANRYPLTQGARNEVKPDDMARMFAPGTGIMDSFFLKNLAGKVDTTQPQWHFILGENGKALPNSKNLLEPFKQAQIIRDTFFTNGQPSPSFHVLVRTIDMDNNILSMILDVDGQQLQYSHGPPVSRLLNWPGPNGTNQVHIQLNLADGTTANLTNPSSPWALNHFLDQAKRTKQNPNSSDNVSFQATFSISGHHVSLEFTPNSIFSPFQLPDFTCPKL
ncbi:type VI secretion system membrane subunit TssM [Xenorhabdus sp. Vera]|uniref:type VI secretion system membrane subunit TssM n=1 Tax=Xenorhabdus koppenhoeferi TaxID=351659 RepID=UPI00198C7A5C|nr:type VI secretion system membrane subunit TssM [Xenorhabdus sp. Vera]MBD2810181.1 type VI secretion system membrane subunit TssM [Xenorhabdus sp. Vera]